MINSDQLVSLKKGGNLFFIQVILDLQTNQIIRNRMLNLPFIRALSSLLDNTTLLLDSEDNPSLNDLASIGFEFQNTLLLICESIQSNAKVCLHMHESIVTYLLPVLLSKVNIDISANDQQLMAQASESRFVSLKILTDILVYLISEDQVYQPSPGKDDQKSKSSSNQQQNLQLSTDPNTSTGRVNLFLQQGLMPLINQLMQDSDPIPFYAQRILSSVLDRNQLFVPSLREMGAGHSTTGKPLKSLI